MSSDMFHPKKDKFNNDQDSQVLTLAAKHILPKPKCADSANREMDSGFSISSVLEQMFSFLLLEANLIKVSTSRWLHLVHSTHHRDKAQRSPVLEGINQKSVDPSNGDLEERKDY